MRENESDSGDGWQGSRDYISPWAAPDPGGTDQARADGPQLTIVASAGIDRYAFGVTAMKGLAARRLAKLLDAEPDREAVLTRFVSSLSEADEELLRRVLSQAK